MSTMTQLETITSDDPKTPTSSAMVPSIVDTQGTAVHERDYRITYDIENDGWKAEVRVLRLFWKTLTQQTVWHTNDMYSTTTLVRTKEEADDAIQRHKDQRAARIEAKSLHQYKITFDPKREALEIEAWRAYVRWGPFWSCLTTSYHRGDFTSSFVATKEQAMNAITSHKEQCRKDKAYAAQRAISRKEEKEKLKSLSSLKVQKEYIK